MFVYILIGSQTFKYPCVRRSLHKLYATNLDEFRIWKCHENSTHLYSRDYYIFFSHAISNDFLNVCFSFLFLQKNILNLMHSFPGKITCSFHVTQQSSPVCPELQPFITGEWVLMAGHGSNIRHELLEHNIQECRGHLSYEMLRTGSVSLCLTNSDYF